MTSRYVLLAFLLIGGVLVAVKMGLIANFQ